MRIIIVKSPLFLAKLPGSGGQLSRGEVPAPPVAAEAGIAISVGALAANPAALRQRIIRHVVGSEFGVSLSRAQTLEVARLVTDWHGQGPIDLPGGVLATRAGRHVVLSTTGSTDILPHDH